MKRMAATLGVLLLLGCGGAVRRTTQVEVPPAYELARTADLQDLIKLINEGYGSVESLSVSNLKVNFAGIEGGYLKEYRTAKAYWVARLPDSIFVNILNPLTSSTVVTMASQKDSFQIWVPRENKYLMGKTSVRLEEKNPLYNVRPHHLLPGILVERVPVEDSRYRYFLEEEQDPRYRYYVISLIELQGDSNVVGLVRRLWVERSSMRLVRQQYYEEGVAISTIEYGDLVEVNGKLVNSKIEIERKRENYRIGFEFAQEAVKVDRPIKEGSFRVPRPPGAEVVTVE